MNKLIININKLDVKKKIPFKKTLHRTSDTNKIIMKN